MSYKSPKPRYDTEPYNLWWMWAFAIVIAAAMIGSFVIAYPWPEEGDEGYTPTHDSLAPTYTYDGECIRWYVFTDPDTSIQYLVNDRGGCCVREGVGE